MATAFPMASTTEKCVVCFFSFGVGAGGLPDDFSPISARSAAAVSRLRNEAVGIFTKAGSPRSVLRLTNARRSASASTMDRRRRAPSQRREVLPLDDAEDEGKRQSA